LGSIGWLLLLATIGITMTDVVVDALGVETGQPRGITGQIQAVQWFSHSVAGLLVGAAGGYIAQHSQHRTLFTGCGLLAFCSSAVVLLGVREATNATNPRGGVHEAWAELMSGGRLLALLLAGLFLFLWNFNPFSSNVLQSYLTQQLGFDEQFYGHLVSFQALGMILGCVTYWWYCRRVPFGLLINASVLAGIISTLGYWLVRDRTTAVLASVIYGIAWQTGTLIQLDLSARICPIKSAGTMFALLMAISNTGLNLGIYVGGDWYEQLASSFDGNYHLAFHTLVGIAALFTAGCWILVPFMQRAGTE
jgi:Na+/melibiose symporter-like transporter